MNSCKATYIGLFLAVMSLFSSCSNVAADGQANFKALSDSLSNANKSLAAQNDSLYMAMEGKLSDPRDHQLAQYWFPRAQLFQYNCNEIYKYLEKYTANVGVDSFLNKGDSLSGKLHEYKKYIFRIDPEIYAVVKSAGNNMTRYFDSIKGTGPASAGSRFPGKSNDELVYILTRIRNTIEVAEHTVLSFCPVKIADAG